jgi:GH15 family glucan-1,4-alpha-glucosidase
MNKKELYELSIEVIERYQSPSGGFIACPNFETYGYSWMRDGSFIGAALSMVGHHQSAAAFHRWVSNVVTRYRDKVPVIREALTAGKKLQDRDFLFTRYSLEGYEDLSDDSWGNFQYDGYGTWLWSLKAYVDCGGDPDLIRGIWSAVQTVLSYLALVWQLPSYDCWEEHPELQHPYSLGCVFSGLTAAHDLAEVLDLPVEGLDLRGTAANIKAFILKYGICEGILVKHINPGSIQDPMCESSVDASLLGLIYPYAVVDFNSQVAEKTVSAIRSTLVSPSGGVYRYARDTYYGGGTWILLTAWLGWVEAVSGDRENARKRLDWITNRADANGWLPEQLTDEVLYPEMTTPWREKWGPVADPLLWSHAMYLILYEALEE